MGQFSRTRRDMLLGGAAGLLAQHMPMALAQSDTAIKDAYVPRIKHALLIGNRAYPGNKEIPPAHKNVVDMKEALEFLEFNVTTYIDLNAAAMQAAIADYQRKIQAVAEGTLPGSLAVVFYFCGHGFQSEGQNYLVPSGVDPGSESAVKQSLKLTEDVLSVMPKRYPGISVALIDACRSDLNFKKGVDDFNQIVAPEGTMVFFATRAGRPALAPIDPNRNTFFTEALFNSLSGSNGVTPLDDLFQLTAAACQRKVKSEFDKVKLKLLPQFPEVTGNLRGKFILRNRLLETNRRRRQQAIASDVNAAREEERWLEIKRSHQPRKILRLCEAFLREFPAGDNTETAQATFDGAKLAVDSLRPASLTADAIDDVAKNTDVEVLDDLLKAVRGDKDAAHRLANLYEAGARGFAASERRTEIWLKFSAELGNGIASWQLAEYYGNTGAVGDAARYERRALELGYRPPPRLSNRGY